MSMFIRVIAVVMTVSTVCLVCGLALLLYLFSNPRANRSDSDHYVMVAFDKLLTNHGSFANRHVCTQVVYVVHSRAIFTQSYLDYKPVAVSPVLPALYQTEHAASSAVICGTFVDKSPPFAIYASNHRFRIIGAFIEPSIEIPSPSPAIQ